jgi:hypothetical protein
MFLGDGWRSGPRLWQADTPSGTRIAFHIADAT